MSSDARERAPGATEIDQQVDRGIPGDHDRSELVVASVSGPSHVSHREPRPGHLGPSLQVRVVQAFRQEWRLAGHHASDDIDVVGAGEAVEPVAGRLPRDLKVTLGGDASSSREAKPGRSVEGAPRFAERVPIDIPAVSFDGWLHRTLDRRCHVGDAGPIAPQRIDAHQSAARGKHGGGSEPVAVHVLAAEFRATRPGRTSSPGVRESLNNSMSAGAKRRA